ncbi:MAG: DUF167 family protein [Pikeienuella sp.]
MSAARPWRARPEGLSLSLRLTPKGGADRLDGIGEDAEGRPLLLARVSAAPTGGEANTALVKLIAKAAGARKSDVNIEAGATSRIKRIAIQGDAEALAATLERAISKG